MEEKLEKRKILLIDDHEGFLETVSYWLKAKGHSVMTATHCEAGLKIIESTPLDIVFLDMHMPKVNGVETLRRIRQIKKDLPVILVTAYLEDDLINQATELGISGLFPKEGDFNKLLNVMEVALRTHLPGQ